MTDLTIEEEWVCVGHAVSSNNREAALFKPVIDGEVDPNAAPMRYQFKGLFAGSVYNVRTNEDRTRCSPPKYERLWRLDEDRAQWQMQSRAARAELALIKDENKSKRDDAIYECLRPLARVYVGANVHRRRAIEFTIIDYLHKFAMEERMKS